MSEAEKPAQPLEHRATTKSHRDIRAEALQKALRDNLRRRKAASADEKPATAAGDEAGANET